MTGKWIWVVEWCWDEVLQKFLRDSYWCYRACTATKREVAVGEVTHKLLVVEVTAPGYGTDLIRAAIAAQFKDQIRINELPAAEELGRVALMADPDAMLNGDDTDRLCLVGQAILDALTKRREGVNASQSDM